MPDNFYSKDYGEYFRELERKTEINPKAAENTPKNTVPSPPKKSSLNIGKKRILMLTSAILALIILIISISVGVSSCTKGNADKKEATAGTIFSPSEPTNYKTAKITKNTVNPPAEIGSKHIVMIDLATNEAIAARDPDARTSPASTTKIMTILVAAEQITDYTETFEFTLAITDEVYLAEATAAGFKKGERVTMTDLLYGTILPSGADAALGLAHKISGSEAEFVKLMNEKVEELGLKNTHFTNATGLYGKEHYSTALDMAVILRAAMDNEICRQVLMTHPYTTAKTPEHPNGIELQSTLFSSMYGTEPQTATIIGGKTGYVNQSGFCIASFGYANESKKEYICVTFDATSKHPSVNDQIKMYANYAK